MRLTESHGLRPVWLIVLALVTSPLLAGEPRKLTFEEHIRPILRAHCFDCHGATEDLKGGLDLRLVRFMRRGGESGPSIVPGKPVESYLLDRIRGGEMPPGESHVPAEEIARIERWIAQGAPTARPEPEQIGPGVGVTPEDRDFWSFRPIERRAVPATQSLPDGAHVRTPIDAFVLEAMPEGLHFSPDAPRRTLIVRTYLDLIGLPPSPEQLQHWLETPDQDWFDRLLTELLQSPHYGERWARHWLDVAGYADSEGYTTADAERPWAWKYRDWVIRALNSNKPFDQFLVEQLAGDELAGPREGDLTDDQIALLTATGFLRMAADGTGSGADTAEARNQVVADTLKIVGTSLLGLSLQCAQCHDHRYDPIPQADYYALRAVFEPALDWKAWQPPGARRVSLYTEADRQRAGEIEDEVQTIAAEKATQQAEYMQQALDKELMKFEEPLRTQLREAYQTAADQRTDEQKQLLASHPSVNITPGVLYQYLPEAAEDLKKFDQRMNEVRSRKPPEEFLRVLTEPPNHVPETKLFFRGDHQQPKQTVPPAGLTVTSPEGARRAFATDAESLPTTGRRLAFARWLTSGEHPLVARVIVNRVWMHHFGRGLVATPADFGRLGATPTHPELLDWLASWFMDNGWDLKALHRLILMSTVWRQSSAVQAASDPSAPEQTPVQRDPSNQYYWRKPLVRLEAEILRDRMLAASGTLDRDLFGPPIGIKEDETGQVVVEGAPRRSLYVQVRRSQPVALLQSFDAPVMETNCERRANSTVATQSLMLMNGAFVVDQAARLADRAAAEGQAVPDSLRTALPELPSLEPDWKYGYGHFDDGLDRTASFTPLPHWTGSQWQGGPELPDPEVGWVLLNASGGHPDVPERAVIRRWTAPVDGVLAITGSLSHGSANGNGVRGRIISSRSGRAGTWTVHQGSTETPVSELAVQAGDTIDFLTDSLGNHTSDSFSWPVTLTLRTEGRPEQTISSTAAFQGPSEAPEVLPGQIVRAWELALCRPPSTPEMHLALDFASRQLRELSSQDRVEGRGAVRQVLTNLCQSLLTCNEFLYVE